MCTKLDKKVIVFADGQHVPKVSCSRALHWIWRRLTLTLAVPAEFSTISNISFTASLIVSLSITAFRPSTSALQHDSRFNIVWELQGASLQHRFQYPILFKPQRKQDPPDVHRNWNHVNECMQVHTYMGTRSRVLFFQA